MSEPIHDLAHIGHAELLTPFPEESLRFFVDLFGMEIEAQEGQSVYLRGWGDYQRYSLNVLAADVAANRRFAEEQLGFRLYEQVVLDDGSESGAWMSLTIAAHELICVADNAGASGRLHHFAFFVDTREEVLRAADLFLDANVPIEAAPSKHAVAQGMFLYVYEPGGNRVEVTTGTHFIYDPEYEPVAWTEAERSRGQAWGVKTIETFHTYGTPDISGKATGPPIPPTSQIPAPPESTIA